MWHDSFTHLTRLIQVCDMSHVTFVNESRHVCEWVMSHMWMSHVTHMTESCRTYANESCHTCEWVMSNMWISHVTHLMSHVTHMNESCLLISPAQLMRLKGRNHVAYVNESRHICEWILSNHICGSVTTLAARAKLMHLNVQMHNSLWSILHNCNP